MKKFGLALLLCSALYQPAFADDPAWKIDAATVAYKNLFDDSSHVKAQYRECHTKHDCTLAHDACADLSVSMGSLGAVNAILSDYKQYVFSKNIQVSCQPFSPRSVDCQQNLCVMN